MKTQSQRKKTLNSFLINNLLLFVGIIMIVSGLTLQVGFHMGSSEPHHGNRHEVQPQSVNYEQDRGIDTLKTVWGFNYHQWSTIHKLFIVLFSLIMIYHFYIHWKWYKGVIKKHLIRKNIQVITLTLLFLLVALTGLIPWFIDLSGSKSVWRFILIEIHDKLTLVLIIYLILHFINRSKWFKTTYSRLKQ
jgi:hypothetical protein